MMTFALLLRLVQVQLARTLRLPLPRMLIALQIGARRHVRRHLVARRRRRTRPKRVARVSFKLLGQVILDSPAVSAMRITALHERTLEFLASILPNVTHR